MNAATHTRTAARSAEPLRIMTRTYLKGFGAAVAACLADGNGRTPTVDSVRKVLKDERQSRDMIGRIFANVPDLLKHPSTAETVKALYLFWKERGRLPNGYHGHCDTAAALRKEGADA